MDAPVCPYCRMPFDDASPPRIHCTACGTPHHEDCYMENGGCTVFGCSRAPEDAPKIQVSYTDLAPVPQTAVIASQPQAQATHSAPTQASSGTATAAAPALISSPLFAQYTMPYGQTPKSRSTFVVLGIFLGALGVHNFYAGYTGKAVGQLLLSVLTIGYLALVSWIWAIIEICIVKKDSTGIQFT